MSEKSTIMTIHKDLWTLKKPIRYVLSNRFTFGVPLEDIFPANDVHPQLKNLLETICLKFTCFAYEPEALHHILSHGKCSELTIDILELCKDIDHLHISLLFWASKYFLECLPIPVLPFYTNGEYFNWLSLAKGCTGYNLNFRNKEEYIFMQIIQNLLRLPAANLLLLEYFITFLRRLSHRDGLFKQRINKEIMIMLVKYFAMAFFGQGVSFIQNDKKYKYSAIIPSSKKISTSFLAPINKSTQCSKKVPLETIFDDEILECSSVVQVHQTHDETTRINNFNAPIKASTFINSACQTDDLKISNIKLTDASTQYDSDLENDIYYTPAKEDVTKKSNSYEEIPIPLINNKKHSIEDKFQCLQSSDNSHVSESEDPYIYDDYGEQMLITTVSNDSFKSDDNDVFLSLNNTKVEQDTKQDDMKSKMSKLGWTYTPSLTENNFPTTDNIFSPRPFTESVKNIQEYKLCFDSDDKEKNIGDEKKIEPTKTVPSKGLRDILSSGSMKVKFEFLRFFGKRQDLKMRSTSSDEVTSKIKYKKMDSTRSNMF